MTSSTVDHPRRASPIRIKVYTSVMHISPHLRQFLVLLLVAAFLLPGSNWLVREKETLAAGTPMAMMMDGMPCDEAGGSDDTPPAVEHADPCDSGCCAETFCALTACVSTGVLPSFAWLPSELPARALAFVWYSAPAPVRPAETVLRPPIA